MTPPYQTRLALDSYSRMSRLAFDPRVNIAHVLMTLMLVVSMLGWGVKQYIDLQRTSSTAKVVAASVEEIVGDYGPRISQVEYRTEANKLALTRDANERRAERKELLEALAKQDAKLDEINRFLRDARVGQE